MSRTKTRGKRNIDGNPKRMRKRQRQLEAEERQKEFEAEERLAKQRKIDHDADSTVVLTVSASQALPESKPPSDSMTHVQPDPENPGVPQPYNGSELQGSPNLAATTKADTAIAEVQTLPSDQELQQTRNPNPLAHNAQPPQILPPDQTQAPMSKSQQKKLRKKAEWESKREERKVQRKEKVVAKRERKKAAKLQELAEGVSPAPPKPQTQRRRTQLPITLIIDCDFDEFMRDNERVSLAGQITRCYSDNKNALFRGHLTLASFGGKLRERFDTVLAHNYKSWRGVRALDVDFVAAAELARGWMAGEDGGKLAGTFESYRASQSASHPEQDADTQLAKLQAEGEIVYLSSDATEELTSLKPYSTYIIGGLVDKNREKGICHRRAVARGIRTAKLPIGKHLDMASRKILATNHVHEIMLKWLECGDWADAFLQVIPKRKGGKLKERGDDENGKGDGEEGDDDDDDYEDEAEHIEGNDINSEDDDAGGASLKMAAEDSLAVLPDQNGGPQSTSVQQETALPSTADTLL